VGGGAHLDTLESVARILQQMREAGYSVTAPESGKALIDTIMRRKAISEFRWTTTEEIVANGGTLDLVTGDAIAAGLTSCPPPPGSGCANRGESAGGGPGRDPRRHAPRREARDHRRPLRQRGGLRPAQAGLRRRPLRRPGLQDPPRPRRAPSPPVRGHLHVAGPGVRRPPDGSRGTHGNLEFLPGKSTGLSAGCFPDIGIDRMPHLYIYNADNPAEGPRPSGAAPPRWSTTCRR